MYWTVCVSTPIDRIAINKEVGDDNTESENGTIMVGDKLIARGVDPDDYVLTTALVNFKWYVIGDDGTWTEVPRGVRDEELFVTEEMVGHRLMVEARPSSYLTGSASYETSEAVIEYRERLEEPDAPKKLEEQKCSAVGKKDGKITGVTTAMEYQLEGARIWTPVTGDEITGLAEGTYYVRYMAADKALASKKTKVRVGAVATVSAPKFSPMGGSFPEPVDVAISSATKGADIYYTLDDSEPTVDSEKYSGPIHISETTTVRAIAVKEGSNNSFVVSATYEVIKEEGPKITKDPEGISELMYDGEEHALITPGEVKDGELYYAVQKAVADENEDENADTLQYRKEIPTAAEPGIYYVWYKAVDTEKKTESEPELIIVTIYDRIRIHFHANGGTGKMDDQNVTTEEEIKLNSNTFSREGFRFTGWNTKANGDGDSYEDGGEAEFTEETDLYAQWEKVMDHNHLPLTKVEAQEPGCESEGNKQFYVCEHCGKIYEDPAGQVEPDKTAVIVAATGHRWDEGTVIQEPMYEEEGIRLYTCLNDSSHTKEEKIPKKTKPDPVIDDSGEPGSGETGNGGHNGGEEDNRGEDDHGGEDDNRGGEDKNRERDVRDYDDDDSDDESSESYRSELEGKMPLTQNQIPEHHQAESGVPVSDEGGHWDQQSDSWTYTKSDGTLARDEWLNLNYNGLTYWYDFDENGIMQTSWFEFGGERYYFMTKKDGWRGRLATGWKQIDGKWYYFDVIPEATQGRMFHAAVTPDGHSVGDDGAWDGNGENPAEME
ncbi:MAG: chitobiase/beta-hexosaminidase C-terminal domain-containing protein [[Clostridium] aminophilum]|uniref:chitobiase/beta-hexosaminidase C-terminal domain-containing protein n=1 Tax=[Clostridium] aminophilum TaxID=1526 RepID=UPI0026EF8B91|nr:chitobiase/beta-hexosaminidase C-terminal domain-containing protein [[Clostridium] aminophilum]MDD6196560.1 chitobiase/beta-hexosaminidase C-terminal domain-containing protein [[Clostridium] aminophilum]